MIYIEEIEDILDEFDFEKVSKVMEALEWKWCDAADGIPRIGELRKKARYLLKEVYQKAFAADLGVDYVLATGGFKARAVKGMMPDDDFNWKIYLELTFEVASWDNYD
jgi:hypothetical protein